jgi:hypothetical protein
VSVVACTWCGSPVVAHDGFRLYSPAGERHAVFCRLEHIVAWGIRGAHWEPGVDAAAAAADEVVSQCAHCAAPLGEVHVLLVRARGDHRIPDGFCSVDHLVEWAKAGGRWAAAPDVSAS